MHKYNYNLIIIKGLYSKYLLVPIFLVEQPSSAKTLMISFIGLRTQEVAVARNLQIILKPDTETLDEVVVVAYGTAKKESLTGSVSVVNSKKIEKRISTSVTGALEGSAPGVQVNNTYGEPGSAPSIRIRGFGTLVSGASNPLYVVDGVPFDGNIAEINSNDIESMSVLKDAASAALYGNRAANGVSFPDLSRRFFVSLAGTIDSFLKSY